MKMNNYVYVEFQSNVIGYLLTPKLKQKLKTIGDLCRQPWAKVILGDF